MNTQERSALDDAVAAEHAAVYAYGVVAARALPGRADAVRAATATHEQRRDALVAALTAAGSAAPVAAPGYVLPVVVRNGEQAIQLALAVEEEVALAWRSVLERSEPGTSDATYAVRPSALTALTDCAVRATGWRRALGTSPATTAFPGSGVRG